jgi:two-component system LytT family response regulator
MLLAECPDHAIVAEAGDGPAAVAAIRAHAPDLVLLDIKMPELDGFEVVAALQQLSVPPAVVFTTAFKEYALQAFDVGAIDYLLKPFDAERLAQALARAEARRPRGAGAALDPAVLALLETLRERAPERVHPERFLVRGARRLYFVRTSDIEWADAQGNYVRLHANGRAHLVRDTMSAFVAKLPAERFVRVHRSVVVNVDRIDHLQPHARGEYVITLRDGTRVTSSRAYGEGLRALLR